VDSCRCRATPRVDSLAITLHPPAYTGWPVQPGERRIVAIRGTGVELAGRSNKPIESAVLHVPGGQASRRSSRPMVWVFRFRRKPAEIITNQPRSRNCGPRINCSLSIAPGHIGSSFTIAKACRRRVRQMERPSDRRSTAVGVVHPAGGQSIGHTGGDGEHQSCRERRFGPAYVELRYTRSDRTDLGEVAINPSLYEGPTTSRL